MKPDHPILRSSGNKFQSQVAKERWLSSFPNYSLPLKTSRILFGTTLIYHEKHSVILHSARMMNANEKILGFYTIHFGRLQLSKQLFAVIKNALQCENIHSSRQDQISGVPNKQDGLSLSTGLIAEQIVAMIAASKKIFKVMHASSD